MKLVSCRRAVDLSVPVVMGIVNVTPDSFSDGGRYKDPAAAVARSIAMLEAGADIIDIGAESTRPGSLPVPADAQLDRLMPVLNDLRKRTDAFISVDTGDAAVIRRVSEAGADMINDVYALRRPGALHSAAASGLAVCLMHMQGEPANMQDAPAYQDVVDEVRSFLRGRADACRGAGISAQGIVVDPGFGFGKTSAHNLALLAELGAICELGYPVLAGLSRKGTLGEVTGKPIDQRLPAGVAAAVLAVERGASIVRTHDVPETVDALKIVGAVHRAGAAI